MTEHLRAWRAEGLGGLVALVGLVTLPWLGWHAVALVAIGCALVGAVCTSYDDARAVHKAAAARPATPSAPRHL